MLRIDIFTLFPGMFEGPMTQSMLWKARDRGLLDLRLHDIRDHSTDRHRTVDDLPYGGGGGMVMRADVTVRAVETVMADAPTGTRVLLTSPAGQVFDHPTAVELSKTGRFAIICGHYEGIDDRVRALLVTDEISIGDYVLTGGELPAMVIVDAVTRHIPGVLGAEGGAARESHADGLLEAPHYTRPPEFRGLGVPSVLLDGDHGKMAAWRRAEGVRRTWRQRPDLLRRAPLTDADRALLAQLAREDAAARRQPLSEDDVQS
jgi:tRNA (guanine37-N1)-methyltransferase